MRLHEDSRRSARAPRVARPQEPIPIISYPIIRLAVAGWHRRAAVFCSVLLHRLWRPAGARGEARVLSQHETT